MLDKIDSIIESFEERVDTLQTDWAVLCDAVSNSRCENVSGQISLLKAKIDFLQQQHTGIIIDLGIIKSCFVQGQDFNNQFSEQEKATMMEEKENDLPAIDLEFDSKLVDSKRIFKEEFQNELLFENDTTNQKGSSLNDLPSKYKVWKNQYLNKLDTAGTRELNNVENYQLVMTDCPKSVHDLYQEFYTDTKLQILHFEQKFGVGQLSKLPKLRTYQRRSALINAINKYAKYNLLDIEHAIDYFQTIVDDNDKTIPWLYNNLAKIMEQYGISQ